MVWIQRVGGKGHWNTHLQICLLKKIVVVEHSDNVIVLSDILDHLTIIFAVIPATWVIETFLASTSTSSFNLLQFLYCKQDTFTTTKGNKRTFIMHPTQFISLLDNQTHKDSISKYQSRSTILKSSSQTRNFCCFRSGTSKARKNLLNKDEQIFQTRNR